MASLVDPRFKTTYITAEKVKEIKCRAILEMETEALLSDKGTAGSAASQPHEAPTVSEPEPPKKKTLGSFFKKATTSSATATPSLRELMKTELSAYLQFVSADSESDPLHWWKDHEEMFPNLKNVAKKYLCVPATSSPSERVFSTNGNVVTCHRASLKPEAVDRLVFLAQNL